MRRATAVTITFPIFDPSYSRPTPLSGLTFSTGQTKISKDGGAAISTVNIPVEISALSGIYALLLTADEMAADWVTVVATPPTGDIVVQTIATNGAPSGTAVTGTLTASSFTTSLTESIADYWKDALLLFTTGNLKGQIKKVSAYTVTGGILTLSSAFTGAPSNGDRFVLVNE